MIKSYQESITNYYMTLRDTYIFFGIEKKNYFEENKDFIEVVI
jgi:hypothetical protein